MIRDNRKTFHIVNFLAQEEKKNQVIGVLKIYIIAFDLTHLLKRKKPSMYYVFRQFLLNPFSNEHKIGQ